MHALRRAVCWCMGVYLTYHALLLQVKHKFNGLMANIFKETFCWLPLGHVLNRRVLVVHGGLFSRDGVKLDDIRAINRYRCGLTLSSPQAGPEDSSDRASGARVPGHAYHQCITGPCCIMQQQTGTSQCCSNSEEDPM